jgi:hypothetical protein
VLEEVRSQARGSSEIIKVVSDPSVDIPDESVEVYLMRRRFRVPLQEWLAEVMGQASIADGEGMRKSTSKAPIQRPCEGFVGRYVSADKVSKTLACTRLFPRATTLFARIAHGTTMEEPAEGFDCTTGQRHESEVQIVGLLRLLIESHPDLGITESYKQHPFNSTLHPRDFLIIVKGVNRILIKGIRPDCLRPSRLSSIVRSSHSPLK